jgi:beta-glucosidase
VPACWKDCTAHDAVRLWLGDRQLAQGPVQNGRIEVPMTSDGTPMPFRLELDHVSDDEGIRLLWLPPAQPLLDQAVAAAQASDVIVAVLGLSPDLEGEALKVSVPGFVGGDRTDIGLPASQRHLLAALRATGKPVVVVLTSGSAVAVDPASADAILAAWYPGQAGGTAIAETLAGLNNPSGRLPVTFYRSTNDLPAFVDYGMKERTYRYFTGTPLWSFGHGLSYTRFAYAARPALTVTAGQSMTVTARVTNTGARRGDEVVQLYLAPPETRAGGSTAPVLQRQLVAFDRVTLKPGQSRNVTLPVDARMMSLVARDGTRSVLPGDYRLFVGGGQPGDAPGQWIDLTISGTRTDLPK